MTEEEIQAWWAAHEAAGWKERRYAKTYGYSQRGSIAPHISTRHGHFYLASVSRQSSSDRVGRRKPK